MMHVRRFGEAELFQIAEFTGPTHDAEWMLPDLPPGLMQANAAWLAPRFWLPATNRLVFTMQIFVLKYRDKIILIDTGVGNYKSRVAASHHMLNTPMLDWLAGIGAAPDAVTHVVHTHLHGDHIGWDTILRDGVWTPLFRNAVHHLPRLDFTIFKARQEAGDWLPHGPPFADSILPVVAAGLAAFVDPGDVVADCLKAIAAPGHTEGQLIYSMQLDGLEFIFCADVLHSPVQLLLPDINSRWCELQDAARRSRRALLTYAADSGATLFPAHAAGLAGWKIGRRDRAFCLQS